MQSTIWGVAMGELAGDVDGGNRLSSTHSRAETWRSAMRITGLVIGLAGVSLNILELIPNDLALTCFGLSVVLVVGAIPLGDGLRRAARSEELAKLELDRALANVSGADDLLGLMHANRRQIDAYDAQARRQGASSHQASLVAMLIGLAFLGIGLAIALLAKEPSTKYAAAIIAAVGTATGGYIAQTFLRVNANAQDHVRYYYKQPLVQSYLLTAERIASRLPDDARAKQFELLIGHALREAADAGAPRPPSATQRATPVRRKRAPSPDASTAAS